MAYLLWLDHQLFPYVSPGNYWNSTSAEKKTRSLRAKSCAGEHKHCNCTDEHFFSCCYTFYEFLEKQESAENFQRTVRPGA